MADDILVIEARFSTPNRARDTQALDAVLEQINALPESTVEDLSCVLGTDEAFDTLRALYHLAAYLANPACMAQRFAEFDLDEFMIEAYHVAAVRQVLQNPDTAPRKSFRAWCLAYAMGSDSTETLGYALQLLEHVRPPRKTWTEWLAEVGSEAEFRDAIGLQDFTHEATPVHTRRPDASEDAEPEALVTNGVSDDS